MFILWAMNGEHEFIELFSSIELLNQFVHNHPQIRVLQITFHEINPI